MMKLIFFLLVLICAPSAHAATYWVSTSGSDANGCTDSSTPLTTTAKATVNNVRANCSLQPGDTVYIRTGTYAHYIDWTGPSGLSGNPITIAAYNNEVVTMQPEVADNWNPLYILGNVAHLIFDGIIFDAINVEWPAIQFDLNIPPYTGKPHHIIIRNFVAKNSGWNSAAQTTAHHGVFVSRSVTDVTLQDCEIHDNGNPSTPTLGMGIYDVSQRLIVERCYIHDNSGEGITAGNDTNEGPLANGSEYRFNIITENGGPATGGFNSRGMGIYTTHQDAKIHHNLIYNNGRNNGCGPGIWVARGTQQIYNNVVFNNLASGIYISPSATGVTVKNTVMLENDLTDFFSDGCPNLAQFDDRGSGTVTGNNVVAGSASAMFVSPSTDDFNLLSTSALINAGTTTALPTFAYNGSAPDQGAFETSTIETAAAPNSSTVHVTVQSAFAPFAGTITTGWTLRQGGATKTITAVSLAGNSTYELTCSACLTSGGGLIDIAHAQNDARIDSISIGNLSNQRLMPWSATTVTNNIGGETQVWASKHFRCRVWNKPTTGTTAQDFYTSEDADCSVQNIAGKIAIVNLIDCTGADCDPVGFRHEYQLNGGPGWTLVSNSCTTNSICYDNTQVGGAVHGATITSTLLTNPHATYVAGGVSAQDSSFPVINLSEDSATNIMGSFALKTGLTAGTDQICVRPVRDSGTSITHDTTACFNVVYPGMAVQ